MDNRTATLTLTEKLQQLGYVNLVADTAVKSYLLENNKSVILYLGNDCSRFIDSKEIDLSKDTEFDKLSLSNLKQKYPQANYLFVEKNKSGLDGKLNNSFITPAAIIGEEEERILKREYYKDVPYFVRKALEILDIPNFIADYEIYSSIGTDIDTQKLEIKLTFNKENSSQFYFPFKDTDSIEIGDIIQGKKTKRYYLIERIESNKMFGPRFKDAELKIPANLDQGLCEIGALKPIFKLYNITHKFIKFAFTLPAQEQNINLNKNILKTISNIDTITEILYNTYLNDKNFRQYFEIVNKEAQNQAFNALRQVQERNSTYDLFLWNKGFKEVNIDYMNLYKKDSQEFIEYFKSRKPEDKKTILKGIMNCDYTNEDVANWMNENELDLIREVSMQ